MFIQFFTFYNIIFTIFLIWIGYLVITDDRFKLNRKFIFLSLVVVLYIISIYIEKVPYIIIKDLFWYSIVINGSFIFHVLILDRIFLWSWKNHYEYLGFIASRMSFTLSFSGLIYLIRNMRALIFGKFFPYYIKDIYYEFEEKYKLKNTNLTKIIKNIIEIFNWIIRKIYAPLDYIEAILIHFSLVFYNYTLLLLGKKSNNLNFQNIIKYVIIFIIFFFIAYLIGIPRLYVVWIFQGLLESYKILTFQYTPSKTSDFEKLSNYEKIIYFIKNYKNTFFLYDFYRKKHKELDKLYEKPYHKFFIFDLCKFLNNPKWDRDCWALELPRGVEPPNSEFPLIKIYKFYPWKEIAIGYCTIDYEILKYGLNEEQLNELNEQYEEERVLQAIIWCRLINHDYQLLREIIPDIIETEEHIESVLMWEEDLKKDMYSYRVKASLYENINYYEN